MKEFTASDMAIDYSNSCCSNDVWNSFKTMNLLGYISDDIWDEFYAKCCGWYYDNDSQSVKDRSGSGIVLE